MYISLRSTQHTGELLENRFRELAIYGSKDINLSEFIVGLMSWVGLEDED